MGEKGKYIMYKYVEDKEFLKRSKSVASNIINETVNILRRDYNINSEFFLIGSGARNLVTQNAKEPIDFDYNISILGCDDINDCETIKNSLIKAFNEILNKHLIKNLVNNKEVLQEATSKITYKNNNEHLVKEKNGYTKQLSLIQENKKRLETEIDNLPLDLNYRDKIIADLNKRLYALYDDINEIETKINDLTVRINSLGLGKITYENVCSYLKDFNELFDVLTDEERKNIITSVIKEINITNEPINNNFITNVTLNFNLSKNDSFDLIIPGEEIVAPKEALKAYKENTYYEIQLENYVHKKRVRSKPTNIKKHKGKSKLKKVTYKVIQDYVKDKYNLNVHTSYIAEVKRSFGIDMYDAPNAVEQLKNPRKLAPQNKVIAITDALKYYGVVQ